VTVDVARFPSNLHSLYGSTSYSICQCPKQRQTANFDVQHVQKNRLTDVNEQRHSELFPEDYITTNNQQFTAICPGLPGWAGTRRNIHPPTSILIINHPLSASSSTTIHSILPVQFMCLTVFGWPLSKSSLVYLLVWNSPPHTPYISSPNHCLLYATCFAVVPKLCHLFLLSPEDYRMKNLTFIQLDWIEQGLTSHQTHYRSYWERVFMGQMTQPTVSKHRRKIGPKD